MCLANETINSGFHMITLLRGGHVFVTSHELWILPMATNGNFFYSKILFLFLLRFRPDGVELIENH